MEIEFVIRLDNRIVDVVPRLQPTDQVGVCLMAFQEACIDFGHRLRFFGIPRFGDVCGAIARVQECGNLLAAFRNDARRIFAAHLIAFPGGLPHRITRSDRQMGDEDALIVRKLKGEGS